MRKLILFFIFISISLSVVAQQKKEVKETHSPKKAVLLSTFLPGSGQIYNKKWWKTPIIYAGIGTSLVVSNSAHKNFKNFKKALETRIKGGEDEYIGLYTNDNLKNLSDSYRNERDIGLLVVAAIYGLQVLDAYVDANLYDFDVSDDLSLNISPTLIQNRTTNNSVQLGIALNINF